MMFFWNLFISIDQLLNTLLLGSPDETLSSRTGRAINSDNAKWFVYPFYKTVNFIFKYLRKQKNHAKESIEPNYAFEDEIWSWIYEDNYIKNNFEKLMLKWLK